MTLVFSLLGNVGAGVLAALFLSAGIPKLRDQDLFATTLASYRILPDQMIFSAATFLPIAEILTGIFLCLDLKIGALSAVFLLIVFAMAMGINLARGRTDLSCGCMPGAASTHISARSIIVNLLLSLSAVAIIYAPSIASISLKIQAILTGICFYALWLAAMRLKTLPKEIQS